MLGRDVYRLLGVGGRRCEPPSEGAASPDAKRTSVRRGCQRRSAPTEPGGNLSGAALQFQKGGFHGDQIDLVDLKTRADPLGESDAEFAAEVFLKVA